MRTRRIRIPRGRRGWLIGVAAAALLLGPARPVAAEQPRADSTPGDGARFYSGSLDVAASRNARLGCGSVITENTTLTADVVCSPDQLAGSVPALRILAGHVTLDLGGHTVGGTIAVGDFPTPVEAVAVRDGTAVGVALVFARETQVTDLRLKWLGAYDSGLDVFSVDIDGAGQPDGGLGADESTVRVRHSTIRRGTIFNSVGNLQVSQSTVVDAPVRLETNGRFGGRAEFREDLIIRSRISVGETAVIDDNVIAGTDVGIDLAPLYPTLGAEVRGNTITGGRIGILARVYGPISLVISGNLIRRAAAAGILVEGAPDSDSPLPVSEVTDNTFAFNGYQSAGLVDSAGRSVNDGLHADTAIGTPLRLTGNHTIRNADYGIEATPGGVQDGGGNVSTGDPSGCLGVRCG